MKSRSIFAALALVFAVAASASASDPPALGDRLTRLGYAEANPLTQFDPTGLDCVTADGFTKCRFPGGPSFRVPAQPGFPAYMGPTHPLYHAYDVVQRLAPADRECVLKMLKDNPTPGLPNAATAAGTPNNAVVEFVTDSNIVTSFLTNDLNTGAQLVVNITGPGSRFGPGYVARTVTDGVLHTYGEGTNFIQSSLMPSLLTAVANEYVWGREMKMIVQRCTCRR
ncbi:hypothetical protein [Ramlibacter albus]|uniref:Uncharacterized protein n=1 Tax=Ramlibacter albus TaxID=2079448 RepID=A0A923S2X0_9BURK|nr:hypothetical protein [Ramlibacter albus]MBC5765830.1 hypothetical protein [Ramlibacter albus]